MFLKLKPQRSLAVKVLQTWLDGELVYSYP